MVESVAGSINAPARPRKARAPVSTPMLGATAAASDPIPNNTSPVCSARLRPMRSPSVPMVSSSAAKTST